MRLHLQFLIFVVALCSACAQAEVLSFSFRDAGGQKYHTSNIGSELSRKYNTDLKPHIVLVYSPSQGDGRFAKQLALLNEEVNVAEELQLLYVVASPTFEDRDGYFVLSSDARALALGQDAFQITLINDVGAVLKRWDEPVSLEHIRKMLEK